MIQICIFKKKRKEGGKEGLQLGGQWKAPSFVVDGETSSLVANARFQVSWSMRKYLVWWPMKGSKFHG